MKNKYKVFLFFPLLALSSCGNNSSTPSVTPPVVSGDTYSNPVYSSSMPDPSVIKAEDGYFYLYATEDKRNLPILRSKNLLDWSLVGTAFTDKTRPDFEPNGGLWAPDINKIEDKYVLYYSMSVWGGEQTCGIGVAIADRPEGPFTDKGKLFRSNEIGVTNSIDPFYIEENGRKYLFWGSFRGIYAIELSTDGLSIKPDVSKIQIAGTAYEGTYIYKKNDFYYLLASTGTCCEGINSTYQTVVGRSKTLLGGYVDKKGKSMLENSHEILVSKSNRFVGNGHNSEIIEDNEGKTWFLYHGVDVNKPDGRILLLDEVNWDESGWPYVRGNSPSLTSEKPTF
ncbi:family 43 glycosylhydrolase [Flavobacterium sp. ZB4R12]|uniref:family 43 glycosylhydrolase n=1 Tax=Flavobacterium sp. ZB4R12 TaxID=3398732 RepID=UPI003AAE9932